MTGLTRPPFPSAPSDPRLRRLGVGSTGTRERPIRAQLVVALVAGLMLLAVPLYLWRRPTPERVNSPASTSSTHASAVPFASAAPILAPDAGEAVPEPISLGKVQRVRCGTRRRNSEEGAMCDGLDFFERGLVDAVKGAVGCAPRVEKQGTINFVLEIDFTLKKLHVFPGASGEWRGPSARRTCRCVERALSKPDWNALSHRHRFYTLALMATYAPLPSGRN